MQKSWTYDHSVYMVSESFLNCDPQCFKVQSSGPLIRYSLYSFIGDFGISQNKCKWFNIRSNFLLWWHVFVPNWLVSPTRIDLSSHIECIFVSSLLFIQKPCFQVVSKSWKSLQLPNIVTNSRANNQQMQQVWVFVVCACPIVGHDAHNLVVVHYMSYTFHYRFAK